MSEFTPQKWPLNTKIDEFLLTRIGSPKNGYLRICLPNVASRWYADLEKRPPWVSVDVCGGGGGGGLREVRKMSVASWLFFWSMASLMMTNLANQ